MPRWQSVLAILAMFFVAGALWPWAPFNRLVCAGISFVLILIGMPWPGRPGGRELFRLRL